MVEVALREKERSLYTSLEEVAHRDLFRWASDPGARAEKEPVLSLLEQTLDRSLDPGAPGIQRAPWLFHQGKLAPPVALEWARGVLTGPGFGGYPTRELCLQALADGLAEGALQDVPEDEEWSRETLSLCALCDRRFQELATYFSLDTAQANASGDGEVPALNEEFLPRTTGASAKEQALRRRLITLDTRIRRRLETTKESAEVSTRDPHRSDLWRVTADVRLATAALNRFLFSTPAGVELLRRGKVELIPNPTPMPRGPRTPSGRGTGRESQEASSDLAAENAKLRAELEAARKRVAELGGAQLGQHRELPPELREAQFVQMGEFWENFDAIVSQVERGGIVVLQKKYALQAIARRITLDGHVSWTVGRSELFRARRQSMERVLRGETARIEGTDVVLVRPPEGIGPVVVPLSDRAQDQRRALREKQRAYRDRKRSPQSLKHLKKLRKERR